MLVKAVVVVCWSSVAAIALAACGDDGGSGDPIDAAADAPADAPTDAPPDASPDAALDAPTDAPTACLVTDTYSASIIGMPLFFDFDRATGTWGAGKTAAGAMTNPLVTGTFSEVGGVFSITDASSPACEMFGRYAIAFGATCAFTLTVTTDPCTERRDALDGTTFTPVP